MRAVLITILLSILIGAGGVYVWTYYGGFVPEKGQAIAFINRYGDYEEVAEQVEALVHLPGTAQNSDRTQLYALLTSLLTDAISNERREELARVAFNNLTALKREVDAAQTAQASLYVELEELGQAGSAFASVALERQASALVDGARKRAELSARITSILSEMNEQTYAIITRILADRGKLTSEHIRNINEATDGAEKRFETLKQLYEELEDKKRSMQREFELFAQSAL
jgi:hypothetical protein